MCVDIKKFFVPQHTCTYPVAIPFEVSAIIIMCNVQKYFGLENNMEISK